MYRDVKYLTKSAIFLSLLKWFGEGGGGGYKKIFAGEGEVGNNSKKRPLG